MVTKRDIYNNKERWENWKKANSKGIADINKTNSKILLEFLNDMELGKNTSHKATKGPRTPTTLINLRDHNLFFMKNLKGPLTKWTKDKLHKIDKDVREGKIKKSTNKNYTAFGNYIKDLKNFISWCVRVGYLKENIAEDLSKKTKKPSWVYLSEEQFKKLANRCNADYKALVWFMYDAGCRVTEAYNIRINDFLEDFSKVRIREETSKTFERVVCLKLSTALIKEYIDFHNLKDDDFLFQKKSTAFNKYLKLLSAKIFGNGVSKARETYDNFSLYDIRHNASCYWLKRYQNLRGLKYRMGWKRESQANYYHEFLGLNDEIRDEDMILTEDRNKLQEMEDKLKDFDEMKKKVEFFMAFVEGKEWEDLRTGKKETPIYNK